MKTLLTLAFLLSLSTPTHAQSFLERILGINPDGEEGRCVSLRESKNSNSKSLNLVFVPSGFNNDMDAFERYVRNAWKKIESFEPFSAEIDTVNVVIARIPHKSDSYCKFDKKIGRLLVCKRSTAKSLASRCIQGSNKTVIAIHNSPIHGGSGGAVATSTTSPQGIPTIIHELGHTMFDLADEYTEKNASLTGGNCSSVRSHCSEWQDLIDAGLASCEPGCRNNSKFTSEENIMRSLGATSFGHVNNRLICCKFKQKTGEYPPFCDTYKNVGEGLEKFCS